MIEPRSSRNDYCPCGSGKKYKNCHWGKRLPSGLPASPSPTRQTDLDDLDPANADVMSPEYWERMYERMPGAMRKEFKPVIDQVRRYAETESRRAEVEAAAESLEPYRAEYEQLTEDPPRFLKQAEELFAEAPFADMRFHAADVQRAFESVGFPGAGAMDRKFVKTVEKAIRFLLDDAQRKALALRLAEALPEYAAAGRYLDAWIIRHSVVLTAEPKGTPGPFLLAMFLHGMREWEGERDREQDALLNEMGISAEEVRRLGYDGMEARLQEIMAGPEKAAAMKEFFAKHPELTALSEAQCREAERAAAALLERADAQDLLLTPDEVAPWLPVFERRAQEVPGLLAALSAEEPPDKPTTQAFVQLMYDFGSEMANAIFTPPRLQRLAAQLHAYRRRLVPDKHQRLMVGVHGALAATQSPSKPADSHFLVMICCRSLRAVGDSMESASGSAGETP